MNYNTLSKYELLKLDDILKIHLNEENINGSENYSSIKDLVDKHLSLDFIKLNSVNTWLRGIREKKTFRKKFSEIEDSKEKDIMFNYMEDSVCLYFDFCETEDVLKLYNNFLYDLGLKYKLNSMSNCHSYFKKYIRSKLFKVV